MFLWGEKNKLNSSQTTKKNDFLSQSCELSKAVCQKRHNREHDRNGQRPYGKRD